jgi:hypothetical protein
VLPRIEREPGDVLTRRTADAAIGASPAGSPDRGVITAYALQSLAERVRAPDQLHSAGALLLAAVSQPNPIELCVISRLPMSPALNVTAENSRCIEPEIRDAAGSRVRDCLLDALESDWKRFDERHPVSRSRPEGKAMARGRSPRDNIGLQGPIKAWRLRLITLVQNTLRSLGGRSSLAG